MKLPLRETLIAGTCIVILAGMGTWQVQRLHWKEGVIERLNQSYADDQNRPPLTRGQLAALAQEEMPLGYGKVEGHLLRDKAILLGPRTDEGRVGYHLLVPAEIEDGRVLIVNLGWVSDLWMDSTEERLSGLPVDTFRLRGLLRKPDWSSFASKNSPANDLWFRPDIGEIAQAKGIENPYPFLLYADNAQPPLQDIKMQEQGWLPRNKHLQYALFWYALAMVMAGVYGVYVWRGKKTA